jgi:hypothetical protein
VRQMQLLGIQLVGIIFGIIFLYFTFINTKKEELNQFESITWFILWIGLIVISLFPNILNFVVKDVLDISRTLDFFIILGFLVMFAIVFYIFMLTKQTKNKIEKLVRNIAIKEKGKKR